MRRFDSDPRLVFSPAPSGFRRDYRPDCVSGRQRDPQVARAGHRERFVHRLGDFLVAAAMETEREHAVAELRLRLRGRVRERSPHSGERSSLTKNGNGPRCSGLPHGQTAEAIRIPCRSLADHGRQAGAVDCVRRNAGFGGCRSRRSPRCRSLGVAVCHGFRLQRCRRRD